MRYSKPSEAALRALLKQQFPAALAAGTFSARQGLSGGAWHIDAGPLQLVARRLAPLSQPGISLVRQYRALRRLPDNLAPRPRWLAADWLLVDYLPGAVENQLPSAEVLACLLTRLHQQRCFGWRLQLLPLLAFYWQQSDPARRTWLWLRQLKRLRRQGEPRPLRLAPLHMDIHAGNLVHGPDGLRLIDWEYAADGDVALELATLGLAGRERRRLISDYARRMRLDYVQLDRQVTRWQPWCQLLMAGWYEWRWRQSGDTNFTTLADAAWRQITAS